MSVLAEKLLMFRLINLEVLELRDNTLKLLPLSLMSLGKLHVLDVGSNFISSLVLSSYSPPSSFVSTQLQDAVM